MGSTEPKFEEQQMPDNHRLLERIARQGREAAFSAEQSKELLESFYPDEAKRHTILGRLADSIEEAHRINSESWEVTRDSDEKFVRLNIGRLVAIDLWPETVYLLLATDVSSDPIDLPHEITEFVPTAVRGVRWHSFAASDVPHRWPEAIATRHSEAIARSAPSVRRTPYARWHAPGVLDYVRATLGRDVPTPGYPTDPVARLVAEIVHLLNKAYSGWSGFTDPRFVEDETGFKRAASALAREGLAKDRLAELIAGERFDEVLRILDTVARATNLLYLNAPRSGDAALLNRDEVDRRELCRAIFDLLHGDGASPERLGRFGAWAAGRGFPNKWTLPTYLLFLYSPETDFFVKPRVVTRFAEFVGLEAKFQGAPAAELYATLLTLAGELKEAMAAFGPVDLIDIQSVAWIVGGAGESDHEGEEGPDTRPAAAAADLGPKNGEIHELSGDDGAYHEQALLRPRAFALLRDLAKTPTRQTYLEAKEEFQAEVEQPIQDLMREVAARLPSTMLETLETQDNIFGRILKNDFGRGGAWPFYWGAFYPKGGKRLRDAQLFVSVHHDRLEAGFSVGDYAGDAAKRLVDNLRSHRSRLFPLLASRLARGDLGFGYREEGWDTGQGQQAPNPSFDEWLADPWKGGPQVRRTWLTKDVLGTGRENIVSAVVDLFERLFPLVLLTGSSIDPVADVARVLRPGDTEPELDANPELSLAAIAADTGIAHEELARWVRAIRRKRQAILYGPPGTGKTFVADHLARHLVGGGFGIVELVQFHPAYAYEDFIQGIRPRTVEGNVTYELEPGRFVDFCRRAERLKGDSVLIIDEINRANLSRVFGELMYLLEYRDQEVPLAGGRTLRIAENVLVIGTMNTADRSIALVDHALRRRFAFLRLSPHYEVLAQYHGRNNTGFDPSGLIEQLRRVNREINDPHYEVGISFFLRRDLRQDIEDIWRMEVLPYLEEFFFDQPAKAAAFGWDKVRGQILGE